MAFCTIFLQLYLQRGARFDANIALDITPPSWTYSDPSQSSSRSSTHNKDTGKVFTAVEAEIVVSQAFCRAGIDHLLIGIEVINDDLFEAILYNNFFAQPIMCRPLGEILKILILLLLKQLL